jgi:hypothetical protein
MGVYANGDDRPTDNWTPVGSTDLVKVDINSIMDFANLLSSEIKDQFQVNLQQGIEPMMRIRTPMGGGGLREGAFFQQMHTMELHSAGDLLKDVAMGLSSLMSAAVAIYADYLSGDGLSSATVDDVTKAFDPGPGVETMQGYLDTQSGTVADDNPNNSLPVDLSQVPISAQTVLAGDPVSGTVYDPNQPLTIGTGGATYTIQGDSDQVNQAPTDPYLANR